MNLDSDEYCTCDVGIFATCPVCEAQNRRDALAPSRPRAPEKPNPKALHVVDLMLHYQNLAKEEAKK